MMIRHLNKNEEQLINHLLRYSPTKYNIPDEVIELNDGNMGSIRFVDPENRLDRVYLKDLVQVSYTDTDGTKVLITLILDNFENLFELEFWKTDFSELKEYPHPKQVQIIEIE